MHAACCHAPVSLAHPGAWPSSAAAENRPASKGDCPGPAVKDHLAALAETVKARLHEKRCHDDHADPEKRDVGGRDDVHAPGHG